MSTRRNGGIIGPQNRTTSVVAGGVWHFDDNQESVGARNWPGFTPQIPNAPAITGLTVNSSSSVSVSFTPGFNGGSPITSYTVIVSPGNATFSGSSSPITCTGLSANTLYTFYIYATNAVGNSPLNASQSIYTSYTISYLIVAGGAGGGTDAAGGGGAGGLLSGTTSVLGLTQYNFTVGSGGSTGSNGSNSTGLSLTSIGGGKGANSNNNGSNGGSGGGAGWNSGSLDTGGSGTSGQGNNGGNSGPSPSPGLAGGGGGAGAVGNAGRPTGNGNGGAGSSSSITGSSITYAGGGGGGGYNGSGGAGGSGGGGAGGQVNDPGTVIAVPVSGTVNTGGGGGGGGAYGQAGASGGSGVVIISVPTTYYSGNVTGSPTVTTSGSNTILKFTGNGSYTG